MNQSVSTPVSQNIFTKLFPSKLC